MKRAACDGQMTQPDYRVVKVGGAKLDNATYLRGLSQHLQRLHSAADGVVVVHGGGKEIASLHEELGIPFEKQLGLRVTRDRSIDLVTMVLCGLVNKRTVAYLNANGHDAVGLSGADFGLLRSPFINEQKLGRVGGPPEVTPAPLVELLEGGHVVVLSPVCVGADGGLVNVNADTVAQSVAVAVGAAYLDFVTDVEAVRTDDGYAPELTAAQIQELISGSVASGGMIPKLQAGLAALDGGVEHVRVGNLESLTTGTATEVRA